jgi:hypothetical protein
MQEIDQFIAELQALRQRLQHEATLVEREVVHYANLTEAARASMRTISESLSWQKQSGSAHSGSASASITPQGYRLRSNMPLGVSVSTRYVVGPPRVAKAPTYTPSTSDCVVDGDQRKRSARSPRPSSLPSITCLRTVHSITISALPTSIAAVPKRRHAASSNVWPS